MRSRQHPAGRGLTYAAEAGHDQYPLPPLPGDFCWAHAELFAPAFTAMSYLRRENR